MDFYKVVVDVVVVVVGFRFISCGNSIYFFFPTTTTTHLHIFHVSSIWRFLYCSCVVVVVVVVVLTFDLVFGFNIFCSITSQNNQIHNVVNLSTFVVVAVAAAVVVVENSVRTAEQRGTIERKQIFGKS